jgi:hypothetical protein
MGNDMKTYHRTSNEACQVMTGDPENVGVSLLCFSKYVQLPSDHFC